MIQYHAHAVQLILHQFQFQFQKLKDVLKDSVEMKMEIVFKTVLLIHFHQSVHLDTHQMVMETVSLLNL